MHNELELRCLAGGGEEEGQGGPVPGTSQSLYNHSPLGYLPLVPHYWMALRKTPQRGRVLLVDNFRGLREGLHMSLSWGLLSSPDTDWYKSMLSMWTSAALHTPPQLSWSVRGFNCLIIILHYLGGPIAWLRVAFSASPHPLLPKTPQEQQQMVVKGELGRALLLPRIPPLVFLLSQQTPYQEPALRCYKTMREQANEGMF